MDHIYHDFLGKVAAGRRKSKEEVRALAKGRVYSGEQAVKVRARRRIGSGRWLVSNLSCWPFLLPGPLTACPSGPPGSLDCLPFAKPAGQVG